jgi:hypothetical protein
VADQTAAVVTLGERVEPGRSRCGVPDGARDDGVRRKCAQTRKAHVYSE